jgi:hypothetical protein
MSLLATPARAARILVLGLSCLALAPVAGAKNPVPMPAAQAGTAYDATIATQGGSPPFTWSLTSGTLPPGLQLSATGEITGTPTGAQQTPYTFAVSVSDSSKPVQTAVVQFSLAVNAAPLRITGITQQGAALNIIGATSPSVTAGATSSAPPDPPANVSPADTPASQQAAPPPPAPAQAPASAQPAAPRPAASPKPAGAPAAASSNCLTTKVAYFPKPPLVGYTVVSGCAGANPAARVLVYSGGAGAVSACPASYPAPSATNPAPKQDIPANVDQTTGLFSAKLNSPLADGQLLCTYAIPTTSNPPYVATEWGYSDPDVPMGRTHYYLTTGVQLSEDNQQFSNQDLYLGFLLDRNWLRGSPTRSFTGLLNSEFSAQLTSIPVAASSTTSTSTSSGGSTTTTPSVSTFISSRKAAVVSGDIYVPLYTNAFKGWFGTQTTGFIGPIVEGGLQTITSGALSASAPAPGTATTSTTVNQTGLYYFWGAGLRLGDLRLHRSWNVAPEVLSHLDLTFGQWENFKQCRVATMCTPGSTGAVPARQLYQPLLLSLEGQLNIPKTPVVIGFDSITPLQGGGQGDLRFFFGVKLDVGCLYKAFKGGSTPSFLQCTDDQSASAPAPAATLSESGGGGAGGAAGQKPAAADTKP